MENVAFIDDLPTRNGDFPSFLYCQRLYPVISCYIPGKKKRSLGFINVYIFMGYKPLTKWHIQVWSFSLDEFRRNLQELG